MTELSLFPLNRPELLEISCSGDVLGIYHPPADLSSLAIYYYAV